MLITTNRQTSGQGYKLLRQALDRLAGTLITTNIKTNNKQIIKGFGIIDSYEIIVDDPKTKRMVELEVTLSEWLWCIATRTTHGIFVPPSVMTFPTFCRVARK